MLSCACSLPVDVEVAHGEGLLSLRGMETRPAVSAGGKHRGPLGRAGRSCWGGRCFGPQAGSARPGCNLFSQPSYPTLTFDSASSFPRYSVTVSVGRLPMLR